MSVVIDPENENFAVLPSGALGGAVRIGPPGMPVDDLKDQPIIGYADGAKFRLGEATEIHKGSA